MRQFLLDGYDPPFRVDLNNNGGGIIFFGRDYITYNFFFSVENDPMESFCAENSYEKPNGCFVALIT